MSSYRSAPLFFAAHRHPRAAAVALLVQFFCLGALLQAEPRLTPDPRIPAEASQRPVMDAALFARTMLVSSGAQDADVEREFARLEGLAAALASSLPAGASQEEKADAALRFLYDQVLKRYSEFQTRVDVALDSGLYNCVSSGLLYAYLAKKLGLQVEGVEAPSHSFCTVAIDGRKIDVETTNPYGFDPGRKRELSASSDIQKRYVLVPQNKYTGRKPVDDRRFIALQYNNRISIAERAGNFETGVGLAVDAWLLQGGGPPGRELADRLLNWGNDLARKGREADALDFIARAEALFGPYPGYANLYRAAVGNALNKLMKANDYRQALSFVETWREKIGTDSYLEYLRNMSLNEALYAVNHQSFAEAIGLVESSRERLGPENFATVVAYAYSVEAQRVAAPGSWLDAAAIVDRGLLLVPGQRDLVRQRAQLRANHAIEAHNRAMAAINSGDTATARAAIEEGLAAVPESELLKQDRARIK